MTICCDTYIKISHVGETYGYLLVCLLLGLKSGSPCMALRRLTKHKPNGCHNTTQHEKKEYYNTANFFFGKFGA